jgi:hypothetical protein
MEDPDEDIQIWGAQLIDRLIFEWDDNYRRSSAISPNWGSAP